MKKLDATAFESYHKNDVDLEIKSDQTITYWKDAWRRLKLNKPALISMFTIISIVVLAIILPILLPYSFDLQNYADRNLAPSLLHPFGTDHLGRDLLARVLIGARISMSIGFVGAFISLTIGVLFGGFAGYAGGKTDLFMMRFVEIIDAIPLLLYVILLQVTIGDPLKVYMRKHPLLQSMGVELFLIFLVLGIVYWIPMARVMRSQVLSIKNSEYVQAAKAQGAGLRRIIFRHIIPNAIGQIIVMSTVAIPSAIFAESFLSFIGLGVSAPMPSWGSLASEGYKSFQSHPHVLLFPGLAICIALLAFNILGDGLRDALDPKLRR